MHVISAIILFALFCGAIDASAGSFFFFLGLGLFTVGLHWFFH